MGFCQQQYEVACWVMILKIITSQQWVPADKLYSIVDTAMENHNVR